MAADPIRAAGLGLAAATIVRDMAETVFEIRDLCNNWKHAPQAIRNLLVSVKTAKENLKILQDNLYSSSETQPGETSFLIDQPEHALIKEAINDCICRARNCSDDIRNEIKEYTRDPTAFKNRLEFLWKQKVIDKFNEGLF
jgi:hypothetical protein